MRHLQQRFSYRRYAIKMRSNEHRVKYRVVLTIFWVHRNMSLGCPLERLRNGLMTIKNLVFAKYDKIDMIRLI